MTSFWRAALPLLTACRTTATTEPPQPPTPSSVTQAAPGGDSPRPEQAALDRLARLPWGLRADRQNLVLVPLPDADHWKRVRFRLVPAFAGFRYGDDHHGVAALFLREAPSMALGEDASSSCLQDFERWGETYTSRFEVELTPAKDQIIQWHRRSIRVRLREGSVQWWFRRLRYVGLYASYLAWPHRCVTLAYAFSLDEAEQEARIVQERFAKEAIMRFFVGATVPPLD